MPSLPIIDDGDASPSELRPWALGEKILERARERALVGAYTKQLVSDPMFMLDATVEAPPEPAPPPPAPAGDDVLLAFVGRVARVGEPVEPAAEHRAADLLAS